MKPANRNQILPVLIVLASSIPMLASVAAAAETTRVSIPDDPGALGTEGNGISISASICSNGSHVAFESLAHNLVGENHYATRQIFVRDRVTARTRLVSVNNFGISAFDGASQPSISADCSRIAFSSTLLPDGSTAPEGAAQAVVRDRVAGITLLASQDAQGLPAQGLCFQPTLDADGSIAAFVCMADNLDPRVDAATPHVYVHDFTTGQTEAASVNALGVGANGASDAPGLSADGRWLVFSSDASNLVPGDNNGVSDIFVIDRSDGSLVRASVDSLGGEANAASYRPSITADGRQVAFESEATDLVSGDSNGFQDIFVHDLDSGETLRVNLGPGGVQADASAQRARISADGSAVVFDTHASTLGGDTGGAQTSLYRWSRSSTTIEWLSRATDGGAANHSAESASVSADATEVAFESWASNLVDDDGNGLSDIFVHDSRDDILFVDGFE